MPDDDTKTDDKQEGESGSSEDTNKSATIADVERIVKGAIEEVKNVLTSSDNDAANNRRPRPARAGAGRSVGSSNSSYRNTERMSAEMVQSAIKAALLDQEHEREHKELEKAKQEIQKAPQLPRRATRWMLGKNFIEEKNK